jgi:hypothetical protein
LVRRSGSWVPHASDCESHPFRKHVGQEGSSDRGGASLRSPRSDRALRHLGYIGPDAERLGGRKLFQATFALAVPSAPRKRCFINSTSQRVVSRASKRSDERERLIRLHKTSRVAQFHNLSRQAVAGALRIATCDSGPGHAGDFAVEEYLASGSVGKPNLRLHNGGAGAKANQISFGPASGLEFGDCAGNAQYRATVRSCVSFAQ